MFINSAKFRAHASQSDGRSSVVTRSVSRLSVGRSVGRHSVGQSDVSRSISRSSVGRSVGQSLTRSLGRRSVTRSVTRSVGRSDGQSAVSRSVGRSSVGRSVGRSVTQSLGRSLGQSLGRSVGWSVTRSLGRSLAPVLFFPDPSLCQSACDCLIAYKSTHLSVNLVKQGHTFLSHPFFQQYPIPSHLSFFQTHVQAPLLIKVFAMPTERIPQIGDFFLSVTNIHLNKRKIH